MARAVGRHTGVKAKVIIAITERPCVAFGVTLFLGLVIGALGFAVGGLSIDTEGWETRGTPLADRQMSVIVWSTGQFDLGEGTPLAMGETEGGNRRRARSLLMDEEEISDDSFRMSHRIRGAGEKKPTFSSSFSLKTPPKAKKQNSRALLQNSNNGNVAAYLEPCADPFWPYCSRDDANAVCDDDAWRESRSFHDEYRQTSFMAIFSGSSDLLTPASLHEMCKVEDVVMQLSGYSEHCARSPKPCSGTAPSADAGLANTYFATGDAATRTRCFPPVSINRVLMANLTVSSCDAWVTTTGLSDRLETIRGALAACADSFRLDGAESLPESCAKTGFDPAWVNSGFGVAAPLLTATLVEFPMTGGGVIDWLVGLETKGSLEKSLKSSLWASSYDSKDSALKDTVVDAALNSDMIMASAAVFIVLVLIWAHTGSLLLTFAGMLQVLLAFPSAVFLTTTVFQIKFFPFLNFIGLFVLIGVGADDCFVFFDKWQSAAAKLPRNATATEVASHSYWEATWAMFLTSLTTTAAFLASAITPIAPIRVFSIFMASLIVFDYVYNITIFASCVAFQHEIVRSRDKPSFCFDVFAWVKHRRRGAGDETSKGQGNLGPGDVTSKVQIEHDLEGETKVTNSSGSPPEVFCREKLYPFLHNLRWPLLICTLGLGAAALWGATKLETPKNNDVLLLGETHPIEIYGVLQKGGFMDSSDAQLWVSLNFGSTPYDEPVFNHLNPKKLPDLKLDHSFDPSSTDAQTWLASFCANTDLLMTKNSNCFPLVFKEWVTAQHSRQLGCAGQDLMTCDTDTPYLDAFASACGEAGFPVVATKSVKCMKHFAELIAQQNGDTSQSPLKMFYQPTGTSSDDDVKMFFLQLSFASNISWTSPIDVLRNDYDKWDAYMSSQLATAPAGLRNGFHAGEAWHWMDTVEQMEIGAYTAAFVTLLLCGFVVLLGTGNVVITFYSLVAILSILGAVTATVVAIGWTLGFLEGICFSILIGLSVDFVIHLGVAYNEHAEKSVDAENDDDESNTTRESRTKEAVASLGFPIISAAFTTLVSAVILFFAQITFFNKFGLIVMLSMVFSLLATFLMYVPMLDAIGPQREVGNVGVLCRKRK